MNDYRNITVIAVGPGNWAYGGIWTPGEETERTRVGCNAPVNMTRNRNMEGTNQSHTQNFWIFDDEWASEYVILDDGVRYTTQSYRKWPRFIEVEGLLESA